MSETGYILRMLLTEISAGRRCALCTVLRTCGSTPQIPGASMLVLENTHTHGTLGGGCIEAEVRRRAIDLLHHGHSALLEFDLDHDYGWDDGLICGGQMTIGVTLLDSQSDLTSYQQAVDRLAQRMPCWFPIVVTHQGQERTYRINLEIPPTLLIAGAGHVGQAVANLAVELGFRVVVADDRADIASRERFPSPVELIVGDIANELRNFPVDNNTFVVIVTRGHRHDEQALEAVIRSPARYLGMIGSRRKAKTIFDDLAASGVPQELIARVHCPIGLPIGSRTVIEIAVSIMAELVRERRRDMPPSVQGPNDIA